MPSRRQIREVAVQFLYCFDLEGGGDPSGLRDPFWEFITESDRRNLLVATFRTVQHLANGRDMRLTEFVKRAETALPSLTALPAAEKLKATLTSLLAQESSWSIAFSSLSRIPKDGEDSIVAAGFEPALEHFFKTDRDLSFHRDQFLKNAIDFPQLKAQLEPVSASVRRLERISERLRMVENAENFPAQNDLSKIRESKAEIAELRKSTDLLVDTVLNHKQLIDEKLASIVENYTPERIDPVDRAVLRLGTYELLHTKTPSKVVINEAIELSKRFGTTDSKRFVNGLLDKVAKDLAADPSEG